MQIQYHMIIEDNILSPTSYRLLHTKVIYENFDTRIKITSR